MFNFMEVTEKTFTERQANEVIWRWSES